MEIKNAIIEEAVLDIGDRGLLTSWIYLDYGGSGQGFGGFALYLPKSFKNGSDCGDYAGHFIFRVMEVVGVGKWKDLKGKPIRVKADHSGVYEIGNIIKDDWFNPKEDFEKISERCGGEKEKD